ncbi:lasso peptide [Fischerella thermalis]|uniref:lasso peptide n=1 Tax=Fischerella thermalis TaxID=372787 RepID=UPI000C80AF54|nr:lasso peptide [Fischerella thermalis]PLZ88030.1 hypothetical protein CI593_15025 [Fischerella thermalis CCMEE 5194]
MKSTYSNPILSVYGDVTEITQILGSSGQTDFLFFTGSGQSVSGGNDKGSLDIICDGTGWRNLGNCRTAPTKK